MENHAFCMTGDSRWSVHSTIRIAMVDLVGVEGFNSSVAIFGDELWSKQGTSVDGTKMVQSPTLG